MSKILQTSQNIFRQGDIRGMHSTLPVGVYNLQMDNSGYFLTKVPDITLPTKIYGDTSIVDRWLDTYHSKTRNLGVLLSGLKGSGKTITAKMLALKSGLPIITINEPFCGSDFASFLSDESLGNCVIFIDEYEKIYSSGNKEGSDNLLSILDGPYDMHHLFIFTVNNEYLSDSMVNRPSRIYYRKQYTSLSPDVVQEVVDDLLICPEHKEDVILTCNRLHELSYDILISIIDEVNRFNEPASKCIEHMNLTPKNLRFDVTQWINDEKEGLVKKNAAEWESFTYDDDGDMVMSVRYYYRYYDEGYNVLNWKNTYFEININDTKKISNDTFEYYDEEMHMLYTLKISENRYDYGYARGGTRLCKPTNKVPDVITVTHKKDGKFTVSTPNIELDELGYFNEHKHMVPVDSGIGECCAG